MKKILSLVLVLILVAGVLVACDNTNNLTEEQKQQAALDGYTLAQSGAKVSTSFTLPKKIGDYDVEWTSNKPASLKITAGSDNYTAEPVCGDEEVSVILTVAIGTVRRGFTVIVDKQAGGGPYVADNTEEYDDITKTLTLKKDYVGKDFFTDGIAEATVDTNGLTDGDTTRFRLVNGGGTVTIRYHSIDTPESTGGVEKWGVAASQFNKRQLTAAKDIVLEATTNPPSHDSYGVRYLGYVWYRTSSDEEFKCLNLEMVENGFSENKAQNTSAFPYYDYFKQANDFAKSIKLRLYSSLDDPLYNTDPIELNIFEFNEDPYQKYYNQEKGTGSKVYFEAYLTDLTQSQGEGQRTYTFTATQYDPETGKTASISVYTMYTSSTESASLKVGHLYRFAGTIQNYYGKWQVSGISYARLASLRGPEKSWELQKNYYLKFDGSFASDKWSANNNWDANLYGDLTVTAVNEVVDGTLTFTAEAYKRTGRDDTAYATTATSYTFTVKVPTGYNGAISVGKTLSLSGLQFEAGIITILNYTDITIR